MPFSAECAESLTKDLALWLDPTGHDAGKRLTARGRGGKEAIGSSPFHFMVFFARLWPMAMAWARGHRGKKHGECVGGEDNLSAVQRCCSHRLALPASEVNGSISVMDVRGDFAHSH